MTEANVGIGVFLDDRGVELFRTRVPAYIYLPSDGDLPRTAPGSGLDTRDETVRYWHGQTTFVAGLSQETWYGIAVIAHVAEAGRIQGEDLYPEVGERLRHALGFHARYELNDPPSLLYGGSVMRGRTGHRGRVRRLHNRLGHAMTNTQTYAEAGRPMGVNHLFVAWETLTHGDNPSSGTGSAPRLRGVLRS